MVRSPSQEAVDTPLYTLPSIPQVLDGQTILITGGAGFVGTALLYRLVAADIAPRRIYTVIRGENPISRLPLDLHPFVATRAGDGTFTDAPIVILAGDCFLPNFGLGEMDARSLKEIEIVIHTAGDTRFLLPLPQAMHAIADLATSMCNFTIASLRVRTHIHLSTTFTGWFQSHGSIVNEELVPALDEGNQVEDHANTYLHAKSIAEGLVNAIARPQAGRPKDKVRAWRIIRLATIGPAVSFPYPGYGAGSPSSPVCSAIAAEVIPDTSYCVGAELDVVPLDIAVAQILAITAACHTSPRQLPFGSNVPIYHVAAGMDPRDPIPMQLLNSLETKLAAPYVPVKNLLRAYAPMISKVVKFDNSRTLALMGISPVTKAPKYNADAFYGLTVPVTDGCIDPIGFEVDLQKAVKSVGGWKAYLQVIRDRMEESSEPESFEAHVD